MTEKPGSHEQTALSLIALNDVVRFQLSEHAHDGEHYECFDHEGNLSSYRVTKQGVENLT